MAIRNLSTASISTGAKRSKFWDQSAVIFDNSYESIATVTLSAATSSITFTSIPQTYKHLQVRLIGRTTRSDYTIEDTNLQINGDTGANYAWHRLYSNPSLSTGNIVQASASGANYINSVGILASNTSSNGMFGSAIIDILDYTNTNKLTTVRSFTGLDNNGENNSTGVTGFVELSSGLWNNTNAVTSLTFTNTTGTQLAIGSHFALYGIKG